MANFNIDLAQIQLFFLIFVRLNAIIMSIPIFGGKQVPLMIKAGMALSVSLVLYPILKLEPLPYYAEILPFAIGIISEIMLGVIIGISVNLIFSGIQLAGQLVGYQMGFAIANVMDPQTGDQASIMAIMMNIAAMLLFLVLNAHHWFLASLADSFQLVPIFNFKVTGSLMEHLMMLSTNMFVIAIKVAAPVMAALLLASICLGLIARTVPRMNVFLVGMPLKIGLGLIFMAFSLPHLAAFLKTIFNGLGGEILKMLSAI